MWEQCLIFSKRGCYEILSRVIPPGSVLITFVGICAKVLSLLPVSVMMVKQVEPWYWTIDSKGQNSLSLIFRTQH